MTGPRTEFWKEAAVHDGNAGAVIFAQFGGLVGVAQEATVIHQQVGCGHVQKLFQLQIVVILHPAVGEVFAVDKCKTDYAMPVAGKGIAFGILLHGNIECIRQELAALASFPLGK